MFFGALQASFFVRNLLFFEQLRSENDVTHLDRDSSRDQFVACLLAGQNASRHRVAWMEGSQGTLRASSDPAIELHVSTMDVTLSRVSVG